MPERDHLNLNLYWTTLFVRSLYEQGVREVIVSPGSRSTPLTLAFAAHPGFNKTIIIDERSAAFTALGIGKASGKPACLVCTSGTALANYLPAVIEASQSHVPMMIASADRPPQLRNSGANQTIDQIKIFGDYPVFFHEVGEPKDDDESTLKLERLANQAYNNSVRRRGVSHLNFSFSKPFEPTAAFLNSIEDENEKHARRSFPHYKEEIGNTSLDEKFWSDLISSEKPVIVVGPSPAGTFIQDTVAELAKTLNAPVLAEPGSNVPSSKYTISGFDGFLRNDQVSESLAPDLILRFGEEPVSKALQNYIKTNADQLQIRFLRDGEVGDETQTVNKTIFLNSMLSIPEVSGSASKEWTRDWRKHQKEFAEFREDQLHPSTPLTDGYIFHTLSPLMPKKSFTFLSNSFPVRDLSLFGEFDGREIYVNRGTAGIDGITSTAFGVSMALKKPGFLFTGDIAFLHDSNALLNAKLIEEPFFVILLNNGGGTIFRMLPIKEYKKKYFDYFETPQNVSVSALCRAHKIDHYLISRPEQLITVFEQNLDKPGVHVLECMTDADDSMDQRSTLWNYVSPSS
jgi:2-succinyl-5-enolpyruvyl-6-hydroxy-3-cyclohexene-1-carboxylate synthase